jgi:hypothetical protein
MVVIFFLCFLAWLIFDSEDGGDTLLRNVGSYTDYIPEDGKFHNQGCENLKPYIGYVSLHASLQSPGLCEMTAFESFVIMSVSGTLLPLFILVK